MEGRRSMQSILLWVVAVVLINALWLNVANQSAPNEINSPNQFQTHREVEISPVFGTSASIPAELSTVFSWSGTLTDDVPIWSGELAPGSYTVETVMEEGVEVQQQLNLKPFAAIQTVGHVVLTLMLVALAWGEQGVRALYARRPRPEAAKSAVEKTPFKSQKFALEDDPLTWDEADSPWRDPIQ